MIDTPDYFKWMQFDDEIAVEFIIEKLSLSDSNFWQGSLFQQKNID